MGPDLNRELLVDRHRRIMLNIEHGLYGFYPPPQWGSIREPAEFGARESKQDCWRA
jgi:hypothetical protein